MHSKTNVTSVPIYVCLCVNRSDISFEMHDSCEGDRTDHMLRTSLLVPRPPPDWVIEKFWHEKINIFMWYMSDPVKLAVFGRQKPANLARIPVYRGLDYRPYRNFLLIDRNF